MSTDRLAGMYEFLYTHLKVKIKLTLYTEIIPLLNNVTQIYFTLKFHRNLKFTLFED